jgi:hypothetical protein
VTIAAEVRAGTAAATVRYAAASRLRTRGEPGSLDLELKGIEMKANLAMLLGCMLAPLLVAGCASTTFTSTWRAPDAQGVDPVGRKVAAVFITKDESGRRAAEDVLVRKLNERGAQGIASYTLVPSAEAANVDQAKDRLAKAGVDGVVVLRVLSEKERTRVSYGSDAGFGFGSYRHFSGYWGLGWGAPYSPTEVTTTTELRIETLVYSIERDELLWAGTSRTTDPGKIQTLVEEVADSAAKEMTKQGVLKPTGSARQ